MHLLYKQKYFCYKKYRNHKITIVKKKIAQKYVFTLQNRIKKL